MEIFSDGKMAQEYMTQQAIRKTTLNIPKVVHQKIKILAAQQDREMSELVTEALERYLANANRGKARREAK